MEWWAFSTLATDIVAFDTLNGNGQIENYKSDQYYLNAINILNICLMSC